MGDPESFFNYFTAKFSQKTRIFHFIIIFLLMDRFLTLESHCNVNNFDKEIAINLLLAIGQVCSFSGFIFKVAMVWHVD